MSRRSEGHNFVAAAQLRLIALSHGTGDAEWMIGVISLAVLAGGYPQALEVPWWVVLLAAFAMGVGTAAGRWRVVRTLGIQMPMLEPVHGFTAETTAGLIIVGAAEAGVPVSPTHTITTTIMGVGAARRLSAVRWGVTREIVLAWLLTFPASGLVAYLAYLLFSRWA